MNKPPATPLGAILGAIRNTIPRPNPHKNPWWVQDPVQTWRPDMNPHPPMEDTHKPARWTVPPLDIPIPHQSTPVDFTALDDPFHLEPGMGVQPDQQGAPMDQRTDTEREADDNAARFRQAPFNFGPLEPGEPGLVSAVYMAIGAGSVCWENMAGAGVFQDARAREIGEALLVVIRDRIDGRVKDALQDINRGLIPQRFILGMDPSDTTPWSDDTPYG